MNTRLNTFQETRFVCLSLWHILWHFNTQCFKMTLNVFKYPRYVTQKATVVEMFMCRLCGMASSHYADRHLCSTPVRRLIVRSREVSKPRDWVWRLSHHSENFRRPGNVAAETPAKFRADWATLNPYLAASRIRQLRVLWFSAWRPRCSAGNLISISNVRYAIVYWFIALMQYAGTIANVLITSQTWH